MVGTLVIRGVLAGLVAGFLAFGFATVFGEPAIDRAVAFETARNAAGPHAREDAGPELVSREVQSTIGLLTGVVIYSAAFGGLFAVVFSLVHGRAGDLSPRSLAALLAIAAFLAIQFVPALKYPANPPSVGEAETIAWRTTLFFAMLAASIAAMAGAVLLRYRLAPRHGVWTAGLLAAMAYVVTIAIVQTLLPAIDEVPEHFPAGVLWRFRIASMGTHFVMWITIGLLFGWLTERAMLGWRHLSVRRQLRGAR
jgi:predicted cobalt transporter CbtA